MLGEVRRERDRRRARGAGLLNFAEYLRHKRLSHGLTMEELAEQIGVSPQFISLLENDKRRPSDKVVRRCAQLFEDDLNYVRFLAQAIPEEQKRALLESPAAPDYLPLSLRKNVLFAESDDVLIETLLTLPGLSPPEEDTPFHLRSVEPPDPETIQNAQQIIGQIRARSEQFPAKICAWADFYEAYYYRCVEGRTGAYRALALVEQRLAQNSKASFPAKLRYLLQLQLAQAEWEMGAAAEVERRLRSAFEIAERAGAVEQQAVALCLLARLVEEQGDPFAARDILFQALEIEGTTPFARARCLTELIRLLHLLAVDRSVLELAPQAVRLWRSSTLEAPQRAKSQMLLTVELLAAWAAMRLGEAEEMRTWFSRARSMRSRVETDEEQEGLYALVSGLYLMDSGRARQAWRRFETARTVYVQIPTVSARLYWLEALWGASMAALAMGRCEDACRMEERLGATAPPAGRVFQLWHKTVHSLIRASIASFQNNWEDAKSIAEEISAAWHRTVETEPRLQEIGLYARAREELRRLERGDPG